MVATRHQARSSIALIAFLLVAAACAEPRPGLPPAGTGLYGPGTAGSGSSGTNDPASFIDPETGEVITSAAASDTALDPSYSTDASGSSSAGTGTTTSSSTAGSGSASGSGGSSGAEASGPPTGGDTTGVTDDVIRIGIHAPITGAAPVPSDSATKGSNLYYRWMEHEDIKLFGRRVEVILKNDQYNPSHAVAVCKEMVEKDKVFMLQGAAGTDQIQACARYAASVGVPYLSAGVTEVGLTNLPNYFATTMTYPDQGPLMADMLVEELGAGNETNAVVFTNTANFIDGKDAFVEAMAARGIEVYERSISKTAGTSDAQAVVTDLNARSIENVNLLMPPVFFLQMLQAARGQDYAPQWVAAGIQMSFDTVATVGCRNGTLEGAKVFSPFPAWIDSDKFDPDFREAVTTLYADEGSGGDDFMWYGWMSGKGTWELMRLTGANLTRERFIYFLEHAKNLFNGIGPHVTFTPDDHFGADEVHVSEAKCAQDARWHTIKTWVSDF